ncbi:DUF4261 domain-containing protein [Hymenobacter elongatus]|uniref:DUF4261 domain-containing protein n=1 Tax=Hymenobacter elongatus TaxID=877208 RepID=A0A4Z0PQW5_9BACT|nr:DUF4261 domain-containing protein [Hymenobacter elongatus]TGE20018.1 DUF4261 domain-containing protein [Hymenobacter elongatus]
MIPATQARDGCGNTDVACNFKRHHENQTQIIFMGLFDFLKKKEQVIENKNGKILLAMPMFNNEESFDLDKVVGYLKSNWNVIVSDINGDNNTVTFTIQGEMVAFATMNVQIPWGDIQETAQYAYNWTTAEKDLENHNSHIIVTVMSSNKSEIERFGILTKVLSSILSTTNCIGVYQGSQSLLISKEQYLDSAEALKQNEIPFDLWIYIGLRKTDSGNNAYTYGLNSFDKLEMEFINSKLELQEMYNFLGNICAYIINSNVKFKNGETLGYTDEQKIKITQSQGIFVEGQTLKLEM